MDLPRRGSTTDTPQLRPLDRVFGVATGQLVSSQTAGNIYLGTQTVVVSFE